MPTEILPDDASVVGAAAGPSHLAAEVASQPALWEQVVGRLPSADGHLVAADRTTFVGRGWTVGVAEEAALKLRESAQCWTEAYPAMEYRHGPVASASPGRVTWALGRVPHGLAEQVLAAGAHEHREVDPLAELVRAHRLCLAVAAEVGLDPDRPRHLTRSVALEPPAPPPVPGDGGDPEGRG